MVLRLETLHHRDRKLFAKATKCQFGRSAVGFLGHVISERSVAVDPQKVAAVAEWVPPASCTNVRRFVGLANFYRKFVRNFSGLASPLMALYSPRARFSWGDAAEQQNFDALRMALTSAPVLRAWDSARPMPPDRRVGAGGVGQPGAAGRRRCVPPHRLRVAQADVAGALVPPHLLKLLTVVHALKTLRPYLLDKPFE
jgi:hypothetical protein